MYEDCNKPWQFHCDLESSGFTVADNITAASTWAKNQITPFVTRQCVNQNEDGQYVIDTSLIVDEAGYTLFNPTNSTDLVIQKPERPKDPPPPVKE